jgi:hypothetical protein
MLLLLLVMVLLLLSQAAEQALAVQPPHATLPPANSAHLTDLLSKVLTTLLGAATCDSAGVSAPA